jgi:RNA polymerase sigma-70 factor, ECF subfamily
MVEKLTTAISDDPADRPAADRARLERMFAAHHATVWRVLRRRGLSPDAAADATQETYLITAQRLGDIRPESERSFLIHTALQVAYTLGRKTVRWHLDGAMDSLQSATRDADEARADIQLCDLALSSVQPELVEVFVLYEIEGLSTYEIATSLEIPIGTVASRLRRAREQFRAVVARLERTMQREGQA